VDAFIPGCPIDTNEFLRVVKNLVLGKNPGIPDYPVCVECKMKENVCVYEKGLQCLGPVTRAGCGARCPSNGSYCFGCRGMIPEPNINSQQDIMQKYNLTFEQMRDKFKLFLQRNKEVFPNG
jgi:coenzyme F420-reducing hydrogenase gamma subunit